VFDFISIELTSQNITKHRPNSVVVISMGVMFDIKVLDYTQVLNSRTDLSITKDKDKEQRKRRQKKSNTGSNQISKKDKKYPFKKLNLLDLTV
tara:strand:- start:174 stop:452 length:279 start_codon:yes stop_codon:yes gene_type:complete